MQNQSSARIIQRLLAWEKAFLCNLTPPLRCQLSNGWIIDIEYVILVESQHLNISFVLPALPDGEALDFWALAAESIESWRFCFKKLGYEVISPSHQL